MSARCHTYTKDKAPDGIPWLLAENDSLAATGSAPYRQEFELSPWLGIACSKAFRHNNILVAWDTEGNEVEVEVVVPWDIVGEDGENDGRRRDAGGDGAVPFVFVLGRHTEATNAQKDMTDRARIAAVLEVLSWCGKIPPCDKLRVMIVDEDSSWLVASEYTDRLMTALSKVELVLFNEIGLPTDPERTLCWGTDFYENKAFGHFFYTQKQEYCPNMTAAIPEGWHIMESRIEDFLDMCEKSLLERLAYAAPFVGREDGDFADMFKAISLGLFYINDAVLDELDFYYNDIGLENVSSFAYDNWDDSFWEYASSEQRTRMEDIAQMARGIAKSCEIWGGIFFRSEGVLQDWLRDDAAMTDLVFPAYEAGIQEYARAHAEHDIPLRDLFVPIDLAKHQLAARYIEAKAQKGRQGSNPHRRPQPKRRSVRR